MNLSTPMQLYELNITEQIEHYTTSLFSDISDIKLQTATSDTQTNLSNGITAVINFDGAEQGFIALNCSDRLAQLLTEGMLGGGNVTAETVDNAMGEAVNILASSLIENTSSKKRYKLSIPAIIHGDEKLFKRLLEDTRGFTCSFTHGHDHVHMKVVITSMKCTATATHQSYATTDISQRALILVCPCCGYTGSMPSQPHPHLTTTSATYSPLRYH